MNTTRRIVPDKMSVSRELLNHLAGLLWCGAAELHRCDRRKLAVELGNGAHELETEIRKVWPEPIKT